MYIILYTATTRSISPLYSLIWTVSTDLVSVSTDRRVTPVCASLGTECKTHNLHVCLHIHVHVQCTATCTSLVYTRTFTLCSYIRVHVMYLHIHMYVHVLLYYVMYNWTAPLPLPISSDLPWYKVFYRALDKISELKLDLQVYRCIRVLYCKHTCMYSGLLRILCLPNYGSSECNTHVQPKYT